MRQPIFLLFGAALAVYGQNPPVPSDFQDLYTSLQQKVTAFDSSVLAQWNGAKNFPVDWSAELLTANCNRGLQLLNSQTRAGYMAEMARLKALGVKAVTVCASFPILYQPFYQFNGDPADYQKMLAFYQQLATDVHGQGLKLVVESGAMFTGTFSSGSGFNLSGYYATLGPQDYITGRAQVILTVAQQMQPDYLEMGSEPDTEAEITGQSALKTPAGWASLIANAQSVLNAQNLQSVRTSAGVGTWLANGADYLRAINSAANGLWYFDLHVYPVNLNFLDNTTALLQLATELGKPATIFEAWLLKERDSEFTGTKAASDPAIFARDAYSFWAPLDQQFLSAMVKMAYWQEVRAFSAFWTRYFFAYLDYDQVKSLAPADVITQSEQAAASAIGGGTYTGTALRYRDLIADAAFSAATAVSDASYTRGFVSPDSVVAIFGNNLAPDRVPAPSATAPPNSLDGVSVIATDVAGNQAPAALYYVSPGQINAVLPSGMANGKGTLLITGPNGASSISPITVTAVSPTLFSANASGQGPAAAVFTKVNADGSRTTGLTFQCGATAGSCVNVPIDVSDPSAQVYLALFGTGIRHATSLLSVGAKINGATLPVQSYGAQSQYPGLDQVNVLLPQSLQGQGERVIQLTVSGQAANAVTVNIR